MAIHTCQRSQPSANSLLAYAHGEFAGTLHSLSFHAIKKKKTLFSIINRNKLKINFYITMFLLITAIPFFLFSSKKTKTDKAQFIESKSVSEFRDSIKLFEIIDGVEEEYPMRFNEQSRNEAYFYKDTVVIRLNAGFLGGYNLSIRMVKDEYTSKLTNYDCTWWEDLKIKEQKLELEDFYLVNNGKLKGEYYCEANHMNKFTSRPQKVKIRGYFEMNLVDVEERKKLGN